jgi:hypothetical protein
LKDGIGGIRRTSQRLKYLRNKKIKKENIPLSLGKAFGGLKMSLVGFRRLKGCFPSLLLITLTLAYYITVIPEAKAGIGITLTGGYGTANIDGVMNPGEWSAAATASFGPFTVGPQTITGTLYMMNDDKNLYIGVVIDGDDDFSDGDGFHVYFDNDWGAETYMESGDDGVVAYGAFGFKDLHVSDFGIIEEDRYFTIGSDDGLAAGSRQGSSNVFELSHPLNSGDSDDFSLSAGQTVGFSFEPLVDGNYYPVTINRLGRVGHPDTYANYVVAPSTPSQPTGGSHVGLTLSTTDPDGKPKSEFRRGEGVAAKITVKNDGGAGIGGAHILATFYDSNNVPVSFIFDIVDLGINEERTSIKGFTLTPSAATGTYRVEVIVLTDFLANGGVSIPDGNGSIEFQVKT